MLEEHLGSIYTFSFVLGLGFAVLSAVLSAFSGDSDAHHGDLSSSHELVHDGGDGVVDIHHAGHDASHAHADGGDSNLPGPALFSPMTISVFATSFGGFGICWQKVFGNYFAVMGIIAGIIFACMIAVLTFYAFAMVFREVQSSSNVKISDMIGLTGEMTVGINDENPIGQVVFAAKGRRQVSMARSIDGKMIEKNRKVNIIKADKNYLFVQE
jgi:hypothetical protein